MIRPNRLSLLAVLGAAIAVADSRAQSVEKHPVTSPVPGSARQLVVVTTPTWDTTTGTLWRFTRADAHAPWQPVGASIPVVVGRTGLAWGVGFDADGKGGAPHKHEGDGKSPAGVFPLDTVFGFAPASEMSSVHMPYAQLTAESDCVDDTTSTHYNTVVERGSGPLDWSSAEHMRKVGQYEIGVIVGYNAAPPRRGRGSCIFLHIWNGPASYTAGCTAFDRDALRQLIAWLDRTRQPTLVQLPGDEYARLRAKWALPRLTR
jgi:D-alanyl-D-alanine dipeptidase